MKIRLDYVTNSSSSSFIISCNEVLDKDALAAYIKDEYGRKGQGIMDYICSGAEVKEECKWINDNLYINRSDIDSLDDNKDYLFVKENKVCCLTGHCETCKIKCRGV